MRRIHKGSEPTSLAEHRDKGGVYEDYVERDDVRKTLIEEQGAICCYCMQRISIRSMRIEHWDTQTAFPKRTVDYDNLLGACTGGENTLPAKQQHCDKARGATTLHLHPVKYAPRCELFIRYLHNGEITSEDKNIQRDLDKTLNLNSDPLKARRKRILDELVSSLMRHHQKNGEWPPALIEEHVAAWQRRNSDGAYREYCQVVIYYLEKKLKKRT